MTDLARILVVEDEILILLELIDNLAQHGLEALPLSTTEGAAATLLNGRVDALITDIDLPGPISGLELAHQAARLRPGLPIVIVSGARPPAPSDLPLGAVFLPKPYRLPDILAAFQRQAAAA